MKKEIAILSILILASISTMGQNAPDSLFDKGNKAYTAGDFEGAIRNYNSIVTTGYASVELFLNLGNSYYKLRDYPHAILNYERALLIDPSNEKVQNNLAKAQLYTVDKINQIPEFLITGWMNQLVMFFHSNTWAIISMISFTVGIILLLVFFLSMKISMKRIGFYLSIIFLALSLLSFYLSYRSKVLLLSGNGAIVMTPAVTIKGEPNTSSTDLFIIHEGTKVYVIDESDDWNEIKLTDGKTGWLLKKDIEPV